ncbi:hypothetical protein [Arenimonas daejeonensis]|uniref:hypothetical protein n=1 Tax=Arenimonas daejeonensis TaxID=370777 RepID=UPI0013153F8B|nr:hypothetical protein [Arenimonas daejeonensis]
MSSPAPADALAGNALNIKNGIVVGLLTRADELGVATDGWFAGTRLDRSRFQADAPAYVSYRQACGIIHRAPGQPARRRPRAGDRRAPGRRQFRTARPGHDDGQ